MALAWNVEALSKIYGWVVGATFKPVKPSSFKLQTFRAL